MTAGTPADSTVRVSFREVKEESYRALRAAGYSWGIAQTAGRLAGAAQVLWGTGISVVNRDASRWVAPRSLFGVRRGAEHILLNSRGLSWAVTGPFAVAAVLGNPATAAWVSGSKVGAEFAVAIWDMKIKISHTIAWGLHGRSGWEGFQLTPAGDLHQLHANTAPPGEAPRGARWSLRVSEESAGNVVLSAIERDEKLSAAHRDGVAIEKREWRALQRRARKFLVAE